MPKKKKTQKSNALPITATFGKKKIKLGKILKKTTTTDTKIKTRKVVIMEQLKTDTHSGSVSYRGLTLDELCRRLGHYSETICREAIIDVKEMLTVEPHLVEKNLRTIVPCIGRLISAGMKQESTKNQLKALMRVIFAVSADAMSSHFGLLMSHVLTALTDIRLPVKFFSFHVLMALLRHFPTLSAQRIDAFDRFLELLSGERRPTDPAQLREAIALFRYVFSVSAKQMSLWRSNNEVKLLVNERRMKPNCISILPQESAIHFPLLYPSLASTAAVVGYAEKEARLSRLDEIAARLKLVGGRDDAVNAKENGAWAKKKRKKRSTK